MLQILENAPNRLILRMGVLPFETSTIVLDKSSGKGRFERTVFFWKRRPIEIPLEQIAAITLVPREKDANQKGGKRDNPTVGLKSGQQFQLSNPGDPKSAIEAVRHMSMFLGLAEPETDAKTEPRLAASEPADGPSIAPAADQPNAAATVAAGVDPSTSHGVAAGDPPGLMPATLPADPQSVDSPTHPSTDAATAEPPSLPMTKPPSLPMTKPPSLPMTKPPSLPTTEQQNRATAEEVSQPAAEKPLAPPSRLKRWVAVGASIAVATVFLVIGAVRAVSWLTLPDCGDDKTRTTLTEIFDGKKIKVERLSDLKTISSTRSERMCEGRADIPGGIFNLEFRIDWSGWSKRVTIVRADAEVKIETARLDEVRKAADDFLAFARDSYVTGRAPRQSEPPIRELLDKVFDLSELDGTPLTVSDVTKALDWFVAGDRVGTVYILAGTGIDDINKLTNDASVQRRTHRNVAEFAAEFARYLDFQVKLAGIMMEAEINRTAKASPDVLNRPEVRREIADVRSTLAETLTGTLTTLAYDGLTDEWRRERLKLLLEVAPKAAQFLFAEQARAVREHALRVAAYQRDRGVEQDVKTFADRMAGR